MTPYGYEICDAKAVIVPAEAEKLRILFDRFVGGFSFNDCAAESGIDRTPPTCKRMLGNPVYLGTDFYPQIIEWELFQKAQDELRFRKENRKPRPRVQRIVALPVYTQFDLLPSTLRTFSSQQSYAAYMYGRISGKEEKACP